MNRVLCSAALVFLLLASSSSGIHFTEEIRPLTLQMSTQGQPQGSSQNEAAEVLLVGNSYTQANNLRSILSDIISQSNPANTSELSGGGMRLDQHAGRMNTQGDEWDTTLANTDLDWAVFQDQSQVPGFPRTSSYWQDSLDGLLDLTSRVEGVGGESVLFMTWGYREGDSSNPVRYPDYKTMQSHLQSGYEDFRDNSSNSQRTVWIAPVGLAYENIYDDIVSTGSSPLDSSSLFWNLYSGDGMHPSLTGSYLTACVVYSTIYGNTTAGQSDSANIDASTKLALQQASDDVVFNDTIGYSFPWMAAEWNGAGDSTEGQGGQNGTGNGTGNETQNQSNNTFLSFGGTSGSNFLTDHGTPLFLAMNVSNSDNLSHLVNLSLESNSGWNATWNISDSVSNGHLNLPNDSLAWFSMTINIPRVTEGVPLAGHQYPWSLKGVNTDDGQEIWWNFSIEIRPFHNVTLADEGENLSLDPNTDGRIKIKVRNNGNSPTKMDVKIQIIKNGALDSSHPASNRIEAYGWTAAVFDTFDLSWVGVGQEVEFEIGLLAPDITESQLEVRVFIRSVWGNEPDISTDVSAQVVWQRNATLSASGFDCRRIAPMNSCQGVFEVANLGNYGDNFVLEVNNSPEWVSGLEMSKTIYAAHADSITLDPTTLSVVNGTSAFTTGEISWILRLANNGTIVGEYSTEISVAPAVGWIFEETIVEEAGGRLSVVYSLVNTGNGPDGLTVTMNVNFGSEQAIIPPENATWEGEEIGLRSFDIRDVAIGEPFNFRAWADIPDKEPYNGTLWLNITIHSFIDNDVVFTHSANATFRGVPWQNNPAEASPLIDWQKVILSAKNAWNLFGYALIAIAISGYAINYSLKRRKLINEKQRLIDLEAGLITPEKEKDDWMEKFSETNGGAAPEMPVSPIIAKDAFAATFRQKSPVSKAPAEPVNPILVSAASTVLEHHDEQQLRDDLSRISGELSTTELASASLVEESSRLPDAEQITSRTRRIDSKNIMEKNGKENGKEKEQVVNQEKKQVPLPSILEGELDDELVIPAAEKPLFDDDLDL